MTIELKVSLHHSGNRTLMARKPGESWVDVKDPKALFANNDAAQFYRAAAKYIADQSQAGVCVHYQDTVLD